MAKQKQMQSAPWYFFSSDEIHNRDDQKILVQQLPSAALAPPQKTGNQIIGKNNNTSKQAA